MTEFVADSSGGASKKLDSKICGVCGDRALGYNFNAVTCESCKAFFRRNALKKKEFKCPFNDNCKVDVVTRRFCQKCRLKKCFDIGMKKEWIMTDEEKKIKKQKIEENRHKRQLDVSKPGCSQLSPSSSHTGDDSSSKGAFSPPPVPPLRRVHSPSDEMILKGSRSDTSVASPVTNLSDEPPSKIARTAEEHTDVHCATPQSELSEYDSLQSPLSSVASKEAFSPQPSSVGILSVPSPSVASNSMSPQSVSQTCPSPAATPSSLHLTDFKVLASPTSSSSMSSSPSDAKTGTCGQPSRVLYVGPQDTMDSLLSVAIKSEYNGYSTSCPASKQHFFGQSRDLTEIEHDKLRELIVANKALKSPVQHDPRIMGAADPSLLNVINMTDIAIRRLIKMSKKINGFKNLCQEDQIALLKGGCTELMILRSVMTYDPEKDCWQCPKTLCIKLEVLREAKGNIYEEHKRFIQSFDPTWRTNENIMLILGAVTLFNPERPNVIHQDVIKLEQDSYLFLLRRYLESIYSGCEARSTYLNLVKKMEELHILNENHVRVFLDVNPKDVEPLLIEIFDLKNH